MTQWLDDADFHRRKLRKTLAMGSVPRRNDQFEYIAELVDHHEASSNPVLSMDTKKKESLGSYFRLGLLFAPQDVPVHNHDFLHAAGGVLYLHGCTICNGTSGTCTWG